jgi:predicted AlkP superfamily phosphohydrolase/phosphomutase
LQHADGTSGAPPDVVGRCRRGVERTFASVDRLIGKVMALRDDDTVLAVVSDHGGTPSAHEPVDVETLLVDAGLVAYQETRGIRPTQPGRPSPFIDWSRALAVPTGHMNIFVNLAGRDPGGCVPPEEYETVRGRIIDTLLDYRHPATGERAFSVALRREDAEMLNAWSDLVGDVIYALRPEYDGAHGRQLPTASLGIGAQHSTLVLAGAGIKPIGRIPRHVRHVDIAPTLAYLLGAPMPLNCEGAVLYQALTDPDAHREGG